MDFSPFILLSNTSHENNISQTNFIHKYDDEITEHDYLYSSHTTIKITLRTEGLFIEPPFAMIKQIAASSKAYHGGVKIITIHGFSFVETDWEQLSEIIELHSPNLHHLDLEESDVPEAGVRYIVRTLCSPHRHPSIETVYFNMTSIRRPLNNLLSVFTPRHLLFLFQMNDMSLWECEERLIVDYSIVNSIARSIHFLYDISPKIVFYILQLIKNNHHGVKEISILGSDLNNPSCLKALTELLSIDHDSIEHLIISHFREFNVRKSLPVLKQGLQSNSTLKTFRIEYAKPDESQTESLIDLFETCITQTFIEEIAFNSCHFHSIGIQTLSRILQENPVGSLSKLSLTHNMVYSHAPNKNGWKYMGEMLSKNKNLRELNIKHNGLDPEIFQFIIWGLKNNETLETLCIIENRFNYEILRDLVLANDTLCHIIIKNQKKAFAKHYPQLERYLQVRRQYQHHKLLREEFNNLWKTINNIKI